MKLPKPHRRIIKRAANKHRKKLFPGMTHNQAERLAFRLPDSHLRWIAIGSLPENAVKFTAVQALILYLKGRK